MKTNVMLTNIRKVKENKISENMNSCAIFFLILATLLLKEIELVIMQSSTTHSVLLEKL